MPKTSTSTRVDLASFLSGRAQEKTTHQRASAQSRTHMLRSDWSDSHNLQLFDHLGFILKCGCSHLDRRVSLLFLRWKWFFFIHLKLPLFILAQSSLIFLFPLAVISNVWQKKKKKTLHKHHFCTHIVYLFQNCILKEAKRSHFLCPLACLPVGFYFLFWKKSSRVTFRSPCPTFTASFNHATKRLRFQHFDVEAERVSLQCFSRCWCEQQLLTAGLEDTDAHKWRRCCRQHHEWLLPVSSSVVWSTARSRHFTSLDFTSLPALWKWWRWVAPLGVKERDFAPESIILAALHN